MFREGRNEYEVPLNSRWLSSQSPWPQIIIDVGSGFTFGNEVFGMFPVYNTMDPSQTGTIHTVYYNDVPGVAKLSRGTLSENLPDTDVIQWSDGRKSALFVVMKDGAEFAQLIFTFV